MKHLLDYIELFIQYFGNSIFSYFAFFISGIIVAVFSKYLAYKYCGNYVKEFEKNDIKISLKIFSQNFMILSQALLILILTLLIIFTNFTFKLFCITIAGIIIYDFLKIDLKYVSIDKLIASIRLIKQYGKSTTKEISKETFEK